MSLVFEVVTDDNYPQLHQMMLDHYLATDADSSAEMHEVYIETLHFLIQSQVLNAQLAYQDENPVGFMIFTKDRKGTDFTELPGYGTIMEISVLPELRHHGIGTKMVTQAEELLQQETVSGFYVCAYDDAAEFWRKLGYLDRGQLGTNGLPLWEKAL